MYERDQATLLAVTWVGLTGCGDSDSGSDGTTLRDTLPSGAVRVTNIPVPNASPTWTLVEELRVPARLTGAGWRLLDVLDPVLRVHGQYHRFARRRGVHAGRRSGIPHDAARAGWRNDARGRNPPTRRPPAGGRAGLRDRRVSPDALGRGRESGMGRSRVPTIKPSVEAIFESVEGNLWVRTPSPSGGVLFDVYSLAVRRYAEKPPERLEMASEPRKQAVVCPIRSGTLLSWTPAKPHRRVCTLKVPKPRISAVTYVATPISSRRRSPCRPVRYSRPWRNRRASTNPDHPSARGPGSQA